MKIEDELRSAQLLVKDLKTTAKQIRVLDDRIDTAQTRVRELKDQRSKLLKHLIENSADDTPLFPNMGKPKTKGAKKKAAKSAKKKAAAKKPKPATSRKKKAATKPTRKK